MVVVGLTGRVLIAYGVAVLLVEGVAVAMTGEPTLAIDPYGRLSFVVMTFLVGVLLIYAWELSRPRA